MFALIIICLILPILCSLPLHDPCVSTLGDWCKKFESQSPIKWNPPPTGSVKCPGKCNGVGRCDHSIGLCQCPAGWTGDDCKSPQKRPCTHKKRRPGNPSEQVIGHIDADGRDLDWNEPGDMPSRCAGICDDTIAMCWCDGHGSTSEYGHLGADPGSPPGTPPQRLGRPMTTVHNQPRGNKEGKRIRWDGKKSYDDLYGPNGWCIAHPSNLTVSLPCYIDGLVGRACDEVTEHFCPGQCSGRGECYLGWCQCDKGWFGHDCSRRVEGFEPREPSRIEKRHWLARTVIEPPSSIDPPPQPTRKRPLIFVYDLNPLFSSTILQYRIMSSKCVHRVFQSGNTTVFTNSIRHYSYGIDTLIHELFLMSHHRTLDPDEADFFYVPHYASCFIQPVRKQADWPWFPVPGSENRVQGASGLLLQAKRWIEAKYPYWKRRGGRDHIWLFSHDEGACWAPNEISNSIWLTHWGRMGLNHTSNTAYRRDNYSHDEISVRMPNGWLQSIKGHPCYSPDKDLVIPSFKPPSQHSSSLIHTDADPFVKREILLSFIGELGRGTRLKHYSRGIRQKIDQLSQKGGWLEKHKVLIGKPDDIQKAVRGGFIPSDIKSYSDVLSRSKFCLVAPGDGWSSRAEDSILHGCLPVVIMDDVHSLFESIIDWAGFSIRIKEEDISKTVDILLSISPEKLSLMQTSLKKVWHRFRYLTGPALTNEAKSVGSRDLRPKDTTEDSFHTIIQWLGGNLKLK